VDERELDAPGVGGAGEPVEGEGHGGRRRLLRAIPARPS
jgi:hypothetical protein